MLNGPLLKKIVFFAIPLAAASMLQQLFNAVDSAVVGKFASKEALAAVGSNSSVIAIMITLFVGLSLGTNVIIASYIGSGRHDKIRGAVHTSMFLAIVSGLFLLAIGQVIARPLLILMQAPDDVLDLAVLYLRVFFLGMPFIMIYNFGAAVLRSKRDSKRPLYCMIAAGFVNVGLNLLFVITFKMSVVGVALATDISNAFSGGLVMWLLMKEEEPFRLRMRELGFIKEHLVKIIKIGGPAGIQGMVFSLSNIFIQSAINSLGSDVIAGSAAAVNFEILSYYMVNAFCQAAATFVSQNYGAGNRKRCDRALYISAVCAVIASFTMCAMCVLFRHELMGLFSSNEEVIYYGSLRMSMVLIFACIVVSYEVVGGALRGLGYSMTPAVLTIIGSCVFRIIWLLTVFQKWHTFETLIIVYPVTWTITGVSVMVAYFILRRKAFDKLPF
ncbi:MAG: MATE family efflux transporter [Firmicutes bacterium]|nr:MATE family efflux transporter [Bacillota bacterium]